MGAAGIRRFKRYGKYFLVCLAIIGCTAMLVLHQHGYYEPRSLMWKGTDNSSHYQLLAANMTQTLEREVRLFCWVMTTPKNHQTKAMAVMKTWGKRCTKLLFVTSHTENEFETLQVPIEEDYHNLWGKTRGAFEHIYNDHIDDADWFMKADDDTFVFMENLRYLLYPYSPEMPIYFGHKMVLQNHTYMSGGSGYVLSREALRRLVTVGYANSEKCMPQDNTGPEDALMGMCLDAAGVLAGDSRDEFHKERIVLFEPFPFLMTEFFHDLWYLNFSYYHPKSCSDCLSVYASNFHYVKPEGMNMYEFFKYEFKAYGLDEDVQDTITSLPQKLLPEEVVVMPDDNNVRVV